MLHVEILQGKESHIFWGICSVMRSEDRTSIILFLPEEYNGHACYYVYNAKIVNVFVSDLDFSYTDESAKKILH